MGNAGCKKINRIRALSLATRASAFRYMQQSNETHISELNSAPLAASGFGFVCKKMQMLRRARRNFSQPHPFPTSSCFSNSSNPEPQKGTKLERLVCNHHTCYGTTRGTTPCSVSEHLSFSQRESTQRPARFLELGNEARSSLALTRRLSSHPCQGQPVSFSSMHYFCQALSDVQLQSRWQSVHDESPRS